MIYPQGPTAPQFAETKRSRRTGIRARCLPHCYCPHHRALLRRGDRLCSGASSSFGRLGNGGESMRAMRGLKRCVTAAEIDKVSFSDGRDCTKLSTFVAESLRLSTAAYRRAPALFLQQRIVDCPNGAMMRWFPIVVTSERKKLWSVDGARSRKSPHK